MRTVADEVVAGMFNPSRIYDVLIVGGGNAGLSAAIVARQAGASVLLLEQAPREFRGGNSRHARNMRVAHNAPNVYVRETYLADEYWEELASATQGNTDENLARVMINESTHITSWMEQCGVRFQKWDSGAPRPSRRTVYLLGGGKALLNSFYLKAEQLGAHILYDAEVLSLEFGDGFACSATILVDRVLTKINLKTVVLSPGGIQSNISRLKQYWGQAADHFVIRGTPYAKGELLEHLLDQHIAPVGSPAQCHIVAVDGRTPKFDGGIVTRLEGLPFGIVVDRDGRRFYDEGKHIGPERYAIWGNLVARRPDQIAHFIFDSKVRGLFRPSVFPPIRAQTIAELAAKLELEPVGFAATVDAFNKAIRGTPDCRALADMRTEGLQPPKTRWASRIDAPPFAAYPVRPGITFSYFGLKVDETARVLMRDGRPLKNVFAAGLIMTANILGQGYLAGMGMTIGTVFGRIAGREAAKCAMP